VNSFGIADEERHPDREWLKYSVNSHPELADQFFFRIGAEPPKLRDIHAAVNHGYHLCEWRGTKISKHVLDEPIWLGPITRHRSAPYVLVRSVA
jgi:hypothetical protein